MANTNAPNGFTPIRHLTGGVIRPQEYAIANGLAANLASGDLVTMTTDGTIIRGTAGGTALGVFYGVEYQDNTSGDVKFVKVWNSGTTVKANTAVKAYVYDDPNITFQVQCNGTFATANVGELATTAKVLRILRLVDMPNNDAGADAKVEVVISNHLYGTRQAGV